MKHIRHAARRALPLAVLLPAAALAAAGPSAASESGGGAGPPGGTKPTIVLVHGAWADASGWNEVVQSLQAQGYPVIAAANPLRGLSADSDYLAARLKTIKGPVVLAAHSYGGAVITDAAAGNPNVTSLVYIAGFAPDKGETTLQLAAKHPGSRVTEDPEAPVPTALEAVPFGRGPTDVDLYLKPDKFSDVFLSDRLEASRAHALAAAQRPAALATGSEPTTAVAWRTIPSWYLVATDDRTIGTENLRFMAKRAGSTTVEVDAPHAVLETDPGEVTDLILQAAHGSRPGLAKTGTGEQTAVLGGAAVLAVAGGTALVVRSRRA
ncbi:alpha/beta hydrolase [Streptomyces sp. M2CJ-2]|uniref:alpha/beta fold hydrolase n=1 Tax=Streptomyces sp. M2CJ-2 TaxID=2803948 RepID=UPI0019267A83|nr:alpha/beta hydrolase [Streptomyces sp. M2CJ-2]MBL3670399.1 alpha/beta hydrolase [Streptomyces sp. M2CJ-2]